MTLGEQIRRAREAKNLSQEALAEQLGVSRQAVSKWENGTAAPQGANRAALIEILELDAEREISVPHKRDVLRWLGWAAAGILLVAFILVVIPGNMAGPGSADSASETPEPSTTPTETLSPEQAEEKPELVSVRFYGGTQEEVQSVSEYALEYNTAAVDGILVQWTGGLPLDTAKMFFLPNNAQNPSEAELLEVKHVAEKETAVLFSASYLHDESRRGTVYFELCFQGGLTLSSSEIYRVYYWARQTQLVYVRDLADGRLTYDKVEWVAEGSERAKELGIENTNNGFELYNEQTVWETAPISENAGYWVLDLSSPSEPVVDSQDTFLANLEYYHPCLCEIEIENGVIFMITQQYLP